MYDFVQVFLANLPVTVKVKFKIYINLRYNYRHEEIHLINDGFVVDAFVSASG